MMKLIARLEQKVGDKLFHLHFDNDVSIAHIKEAVFQFMKQVGQIEDNIISAQQKSEESKVEELPQEAPKE